MDRFKNWFRRKLLLNSISIVKLIGKTRIHFGKRKIVGRHYYKLRNILQPGMVLLSKQDGNLTNLFVPGFWTHAAIVSHNEEIIEAIGEGVRVTNLFDFCKEEDHIAAFYPKFCGTLEMQSVVWYAMRQVGTPYDFLFDPNNKAFYCAELVYEAYNHATREKIPFKRKNTMGIPAYIPQFIEEQQQYWEKRYSSD